MDKFGAVLKNPSSRWASPAVAVPTPGTDEISFTVYLSGPNCKTQLSRASRPHLESKIQLALGCKLFLKLDVAHPYCELPLDASSQ